MRPSRFPLPHIEELKSWMEGLPSKARPQFVKIDLQNVYGSVVLPRWWRRLFVVSGKAVRCLPFGWAFSPTIVQELASRLVRNCMRGSGVRTWVHLDDKLLASTAVPRLQRARDRALLKLAWAGFLISQKRRGAEPCASVTLVRKEVCGGSKCTTNSPASIARCFVFAARPHDGPLAVGAPSVPARQASVGGQATLLPAAVFGGGLQGGGRPILLLLSAAPKVHVHGGRVRLPPPPPPRSQASRTPRVAAAPSIFPMVRRRRDPGVSRRGL